MIAVPFTYERAATLDEALAKLGEGGKVVAGGHSLVPLMKLRLSEPGRLIDIARIPGLSGIRDSGGRSFRRVFAARDLQAMMAVWAPGDDIACIHPFGTRLVGQATVRGSWEAIFTQTASLSFRIGEVQVFALDALSVHVVHEHIHVGAHAQSEPPLIATNVHRLIGASWRMVVELGPVNATIHQVDENVSVADLEKLPAIYFDIAKRLLV